MPRRWTLCHTADWHLGHTLHGRSREAEHAAFAAWLVDLLAERAVDVLLVAGDVFDTASPPGSAQAQFYDLIASLRARCPALEVIVVAGNHDSPSRLSAPDPVLRSMGVRVIGSVPWIGRGKDQRIDAGSMVLPIHARGELVGHALAIPYLRASDLPPLDGSDRDDPAERIARASRRVYDEVAAVARARKEADHAIVALGHCCVAGARMSEGSERTVVGGSAGALPVDVFPQDVAYVALGHLHLAQSVGGREGVRYSGSPIPLALGEHGYAHEVRLVTIEGARVVAQEGVRVPRSVEIVRVPAEPAPLEDALAALRALDLDDALPEPRWPWIEARVRLDAPEPALRNKVEEALAGRPARLVKITVERRERGEPIAPPSRELADLDVRDVFLRRWRREHDGDPPPDVAAAFEEALARALAAEAP